MKFTMDGLSRSLADYLAPDLPHATFYVGPNQQGTHPPAMFLRQTNARISLKPGGRLLRRLGLDLVYLERLNQPQGDRLLQGAADVLDGVMETFPYRCGGASTLLRTYNRMWEIAESTMHYKFDLKLHLTVEEDGVLMQSIQELNWEERP